MTEWEIYWTSPKIALKVVIRLTGTNDTRGLTKIILDEMTNSNYDNTYTHKRWNAMTIHKRRLNTRYTSKRQDASTQYIHDKKARYTINSPRNPPQAVQQSLNSSAQRRRNTDPPRLPTRTIRHRTQPYESIRLTVSTPEPTPHEETPSQLFAKTMTHDNTRETNSPVATRILSPELENVRCTTRTNCPIRLQLSVQLDNIVTTTISLRQCPNITVAL